MSYLLRKATLEDVPVLLNFEQGVIEAERPMDPTIQDGSISYYHIPDFITADDAELLVIECDGQLVASGYAKIKEDRHYLKHDKQGYLGFMFVTDEHRGKGLNKMIVDGLVEWCKSKGIHEIRLHVYEDNPSAIRAYEKVGFKKHMINMRMGLKAKKPLKS